MLSCEREIGNSHDTFAVAIKNSSEVVGRVPRFLSSIYSLQSVYEEATIEYAR